MISPNNLNSSFSIQVKRIKRTISKVTLFECRASFSRPASRDVNIIDLLKELVLDLRVMLMFMRKCYKYTKL